MSKKKQNQNKHSAKRVDQQQLREQEQSSRPVVFGYQTASNLYMKSYMGWEEKIYSLQSRLGQWHQKWSSTISLPTKDMSFGLSVLFAFTLFAIGLFTRYWYVMNHFDNDLMWFRGDLAIVSPDAFLYSRIVQDWVDYGFSLETWQGFHLPATPAMLTMSYVLIKLTGMSPNHLMALFPVLVSPLVVFPIIGIGRLYGQTLISGFVALTLLISSIYYRRTRVGYFDSDVFAVFAILTAIYLSLVVIRNPSYLRILALVFFLSIYSWFDKKLVGLAIYISFISMYVYRWWPSKKFNPQMLLILVPAFEASVAGSLGLMVGSVALLWALRHSSFWEGFRMHRAVRPALLILLVTLVFSGSFLKYVNFYYDSYVVRATVANELETEKSEDTLNYKLSTTTISELQKKSYSQLSNEVTSTTYLLTLGLLGLLVWWWFFPSMLIFTPFAILGLAAMVAGVRFSLFLSIVYPFGISAFFFGIYYWSKPFLSSFASEAGVWFGARKGMATSKLRAAINKSTHFITVRAILVACLIAILQPSYNLVANFPLRVLLIPHSVETLASAKEFSKPVVKGDAVIFSWWDFGYIMRAMTQMNTLIDGNQPLVDDYIVAKAFSSDSQTLMANLLRFTAERMRYTSPPLLFDLVTGTRHPNRAKHADLFIESMRQPSFDVNKYVVPRRDVYIYLNHYLLVRHTVIRSFTNEALSDLGKGTKGENYFYRRKYEVDTSNGGEKLKLSQHAYIDVKRGEYVNARNPRAVQRTKINTIAYGNLTRDGYKMKTIVVDPNSKHYVIAVPNFGVFFVDEKNYNANFLQMFIFRNYDKDLFELVESNHTSLLFRLKI